MRKLDFDLCIVGAGPAGLSAAINGASEGLSVCLLDAGTLGGQARESSAIENYPMPLGREQGVTGETLIGGFIRQALKFNVLIECPALAISLDAAAGALLVHLADGSEITARAVLLSLGLSWRKLDAHNLPMFLNRGVTYGLPQATAIRRGSRVGIVGGANSAGQAALRAAERAEKVFVLTRSPLRKGMSDYLVQRIEANPRISVVENASIEACEGGARLRTVHLTNNKALALDSLAIFIGATPRTGWLKQRVALCDSGFILASNGRLPFETSLTGVFAAGDVRSGSTKRIVAAVGEGVNALQSIHSHLQN